MRAAAVTQTASKCLNAHVCGVLVLAVSMALGGCEAADQPGAPAAADAAVASQPSAADPHEALYAYGDWGDPFANLPAGAEQRQRVCESGHDDSIRRLFCKKDAPQITSLNDLQVALQLDPTKLAGVGGSALAGHSTSLSTRAISAINPRVITFRLLTDMYNGGRGGLEMVILAFHRGEQFVELATFTQAEGNYFYVVHFDQACNDRPEGCLPGELLTDSVEKNWRNVALYDEASLENTVLDCATCHQPDGPGTRRILRMQEFDDPWTHWFFNVTPGGKALVDDYTAARGDETIAGLLRQDIGGISPGGLETVVGGGDHYQPNMFDSESIEREVKESAELQGGNQPFDNRIPGTSPTWQLAYEASKRGDFIPTPYHDVKVTDAVKLQRATEAYQAYRSGDLPREALPDIRDVFPDDHALLARMGMSTEPGLSGEEVLIQACSQCHNERLNQSLSRARFRPDIASLSRAEKDAAIARLMLPPNSVFAMPPARLRVLSREARERAIEALRR